MLQRFHNMFQSYEFTYKNKNVTENIKGIHEVHFDENMETDHIEEEHEVTNKRIGDFFHSIPQQCTCHINNTSNDIIWKCEIATCEEWQRLNEEQQQFVELINKVSKHEVFELENKEQELNKKHHLKMYGKKSFFHLFNQNNKSIVFFLNGMGGTGKTEILKYMQKHTNKKFHFINLKHILLANFFEACCKKHTNYNGLFPQNNSRIYLSTIARLCQYIKFDDNDDTAYEDFVNDFLKYRHRMSTRKVNNYTDFYICVIEEYSTVSPAIFVIILKLINEVFSKTIFIVCGDQNQCKPINFNKSIFSSYHESMDIQKDALPRRLIDLAIIMYGKNCVYECNLKRLIRSSQDENLQYLIKHMWENADQEFEDRRHLLCSFMKTHGIKTTSKIDIEHITDDYLKLLKNLESGNGEDGSHFIKTFNIPFRIIAMSNEMCNSVNKKLIKTIYQVLALKWDLDILKKYIAQYRVGHYNQYLIVGFPYKIIKNMGKKSNGLYKLLNGTFVKIIKLEYNNDLLISIIIRNECNKNFRVFPTRQNFDNRIKEKDQVLCHIGFPLQLNITENVFQSQGMTITSNVYLDCSQGLKHYCN